MINKLTALILLAVIGLIMVACGAASDDVPSLGAIPTTAPDKEPLDNEAKMMAFTQCMRDQGIDLKDPVVDADGNVQKPELVSGAYDERFKAAWDSCAHHLEGFTWGKKRVDESDYLDQMVKLATCLRAKGYDVADPTAETIGQWKGDFKYAINWDDPKAVADYEECSGNAGGGKGKK
jgi:hypothetical protein